MDLGPLPHKLNSHELEPNLGGPDYDNGGFMGYPARQGWQIDKLRKGDIVGSRIEWDMYSQMLFMNEPDQVPQSNEELFRALIGPFIQTWIFFGLFHEALGRPIERGECLVTRVDDDGCAKTDLSARKLFKEFVQRKDLIKDDRAWCENFSSCLRYAGWVLNDLDRLLDVFGSYFVTGIVHLSLRMLVNTLDAYSVIWCQPHIRPGNASGGRCRWLEEKLLDAKWCPNLINRLKTDLGLEGLYFASLLGSISDGREHSACTKTACVAYNIGKSQKYKIWHYSQYCKCKDETCTHFKEGCPCKEPANVEDVFIQISAVLQTGAIPLVSICESETGLTLQVTPFQPGMAFVAISHVWSDGMGNPDKNTLPSCTLQALDFVIQKALHRAGKPEPPRASYFWIDTLCIPLTPFNLRVAGIASITQVFSDADCVLVICRELNSVPCPHTPDEALVRIFRSNWMTRLWTLPEGALSKTLAFQFSNTAIDYSYLDDLIIAANYAIGDTSRLVGNRANIGLNSIMGFHWRDYPNCTQRKDRKELYASLWSALRHRSTSKASDMAICATILLDLPLQPILKSPDSQKMETFWRNQTQIPSGVLWVNGPRMDTPSLRWAPVSLLDPRTWALSFPERGPWATKIPEGLEFRGIEAFWLRDAPLPSVLGGVIEFIDPRGDETTTYFVTLMQNVGMDSWQEIAEHWTGCVALLWQEAPTKEHSAAGILLSGEKAKGDDTNRQYARWLAQVSVFVKGGEWDDIMLETPTDFSNDGRIVRTEAPVSNVPAVEYIGMEREWCIK